MTRFRFFLFLFLIAFVSCEEEPPLPPPEQLLNEEVYIELFVELNVLDAFLQATGMTEVSDSLKNQLYQDFGIPEQVFIENHTFYQSNPEEHKERLRLAVDIIKTRIDSINAQESTQ